MQDLKAPIYLVLLTSTENVLVPIHKSDDAHGGLKLKRTYIWLAQITSPFSKKIGCFEKQTFQFN